MQAGNIVGTGIYKPDYIAPDHDTGLTPNVTPFWMVAGAGAEVEVDTETGHVKIARLVNVVDFGRPVNPTHRRDADFRRRASCSSASPCSRRCISTAAR